MANKQTLNVAVIGLGMGRGHLDSYLNNPRARVVGICDTDTARLAEQQKKAKLPDDRCFTDYKAMLARTRELGLQAVSVALPNVLHCPVTCDCFRAGLHVLCEKPMAMNVKQARQMLAASERAGRKLMINFSFRFREQSALLKRYVDSGAIGQIYFGRTAWHRRRGLPKFGGWFGLKELSGGGPIIDLGVHRLDLAMWLMGSPRPVSVSGSTYGALAARLATEQKKAFDVEDLGCALIRFDNGATLIMEASWAGFSEKAEDMVTQLYGTHGGIIQRNVGEGYDFEARAYTEQAGGGLWELRLQQAGFKAPSAYEEFVSAVLEDRQPSATGQHGLDVQAILDGIYKSAATGKEIRMAAGTGKAAVRVTAGKPSCPFVTPKRA